MSLFIDATEWPVRYGVLDADAVAKYLGLRSSALGIDYGGSVLQSTAIPGGTVWQDTTPPELCHITKIVKDEAAGVAHVTLTATDAESAVTYYCYSTDGGANFCDLLPWNVGADTMTFDLTLPEDQSGSIVLRVYNNYDLYTNSDSWPKISALLTEEAWEAHQSAQEEETLSEEETLTEEQAEDESAEQSEEPTGDAAELEGTEEPTAETADANAATSDVSADATASGSSAEASDTGDSGDANGEEVAANEGRKTAVVLGIAGLAIAAASTVTIRALRRMR